MRTQAHVLSAAILILGLAVAGPGFAHNTHDVGGFTATATSTTNDCRGAKVRADRDSTMVSFGLEIGGGVGGDLSYYAYESPAAFGTFTRVPASMLVREASNTSAELFQMSSGVPVGMEAGNYYFFAVCWGPGDSARYSYGTGGAEDVPFGEFLHPVTVLHSQMGSTVFVATTSTTNIPSMRFVTSPGLPVLVAPTSTSSIEDSYPPTQMGAIFGNVWQVTEDVVLTGFEQQFKTDVGGNTFNGAQLYWLVYSCSSAQCNASSTWSLVDSGAKWTGPDGNNSNVWAKYEDLQVQLEAGKSYFLGTWWEDSLLGAWQWNPPVGALQDPDWGSQAGSMQQMVAPGPGDPNQQFDSLLPSISVQNLFAVPEVAYELEATTNQVFGQDKIIGSVLGLSKNTRIQQISFETSDLQGSPLELGVYLSLNDEIGPWTLVDSRTIQLQAPRDSSPSLEWRPSGPLDLDLDAGAGSGSTTYYMITLGLPAGEQVGWANPGPFPPPLDFAAWEGQASWVQPAAAPTSLGISAPPLGSGPSFRIESCDGCADVDGDGVPASVDCDDNDAGNFPGNTEVCDGLDNDCDLLTDEGFDLDNDGWTSCAGDCDETDPLVNLGATEVCDDQLDNDCDGATDGADDDCPGTGDDDDAVDDDDAADDDDDAADDDDDDAADDDDASGDDDDDATDDDDDDTTSDDDDAIGVFLVDSDGHDAPELVSGCSGCASSQAGSVPSLAGVVLGLVLLLFGRFGPRLRRWTLLCSAFALVTLPVAAQAQSSPEEAGEAQLTAAWQQLEAGEWDQAIESARAVRRLIPAEHAALLVWAIAYEGKEMLRKAQSYLLTYRELTQHRDSHPAAEKLQARLESALGQTIGPSSWGAQKPTTEKAEISETVVSTRRASGAFGDGYVQVGVLAGVRSFAQRSCPSGGGICSGDAETRPGLWTYDASGFGGGLSVRAEYFFVHSFVGARVRFDLVPNQPVDHHGIDRPQSSDVNVRLDAHVVARIPLSRGRVGVQLMADVAYGMRSFDVLGNVSSTEATEWAFVANQLGAGLGLRVEPLRRVGIEARGGAAVLLKPGGGLTEAEVEVAVVLRPLRSLVVRLAGDFRRSTWVFARDGAQTEVRDLVAGVWAGVGLAF